MPRTLQEIYQDHCSHGGDKGTAHSYIDLYADLLDPYRKQPGAHFLEIGLLNGDSTRMWHEYFYMGVCHGADKNVKCADYGMDLRPLIAEGKHKIALIDSTNTAEVDEFYRGVKFDVIIDDGDHTKEAQVATFLNFQPKMNPGGIYIMEDVYNLDGIRAEYQRLFPSIVFLDRRHLKGRHDDVLGIIHF